MKKLHINNYTDSLHKETINNALGTPFEFTNIELIKTKGDLFNSNNKYWD